MSTGSLCTILMASGLERDHPSSPACEDELLADIWTPKGHLEKVTMGLDPSAVLALSF